MQCNVAHFKLGKKNSSLTFKCFEEKKKNLNISCWTRQYIYENMVKSYSYNGI